MKQKLRGLSGARELSKNEQITIKGGKKQCSTHHQCGSGNCCNTAGWCQAFGSQGSTGYLCDGSYI